MAVVARLLLAVCLAASAAAAHAADHSLYATSTIVTGQAEAERAAGVAICLLSVLAKVSGDRRLADDPRALAVNAGELVKDFAYRDLMEGIPVHDEQGTRQRPYELTVRFDPEGVDAVLGTLGSRPWTGPRPTIAILVDVRTGPNRYVLAGDADRGRDLRRALAIAAERTGMPIALPAQSDLAGIEDTDMLDAPELAAFAKAHGGAVALAGTLTWRDESLGWIAAWRLVSTTATHHWRVEGVSFDAAFRDALGGAAQVLSDSGRPD